MVQASSWIHWVEWQSCIHNELEWSWVWRPYHHRSGDDELLMSLSSGDPSLRIAVGMKRLKTERVNSKPESQYLAVPLLTSSCSHTSACAHSREWLPHSDGWWNDNLSSHAKRQSGAGKSSWPGVLLQHPGVGHTSWASQISAIGCDQLHWHSTDDGTRLRHWKQCLTPLRSWVELQCISLAGSRVLGVPSLDVEEAFKRQWWSVQTGLVSS